MKYKLNLKKERQKYFIIGYLTMLLLFLSMLLTIMFVSISSAQIIQQLEFNEGDDFILIQNCGLCTFVNISSIVNDDGTIILTETAMVRNGTFYTFDINDNFPIGEYIVNTYGDSGTDGEITTSPYRLIITNDDKHLFYIDTNSILGIVMIIIFFVLAIGLFLFKMYLYSGMSFLIMGFILLFSNFNIPISIIIIALGVVIIVTPETRL